ncbi:hypothetical protein BDW22DRAFT_1360686, partial [Trametopsis cervina]
MYVPPFKALRVAFWYGIIAGIVSCVLSWSGPSFGYIFAPLRGLSPRLLSYHVWYTPVKPWNNFSDEHENEPIDYHLLTSIVLVLFVVFVTPVVLIAYVRPTAHSRLVFAL